MSASLVVHDIVASVWSLIGAGAEPMIGPPGSAVHPPQLEEGGFGTGRLLHETASWRGWVCLAVFVLAYLAVMTEEFHAVKKSKPVILAAGCIWAIIASGAATMGIDEEAIHSAVLHDLADFAQMFLFLLAAMTFINSMNERKVFAALRAWLVGRGWSYRRLFWVTGVMAFFLSAVLDNLITALLMGAVVTAVGRGSAKFVPIACVNVVCAANAGGAFSPFGDITTLMVWQAKKLEFFEFMPLFLPCVVTYLVPAFAMSFFVPDSTPEPVTDTTVLKRGAMRICALFLGTVAMAVCFEHFWGIPPFLGMMTGMGALMVFTHIITITSDEDSGDKIDIYRQVGHAEWDTLLFFFGVIFSVGGLRFLGYLDLVSHALYDNLGASKANIAIGVVSAVVDNIPVMFSVLAMNPTHMDDFQWLLITLAAGVGGSMLSIGSAAGVGLMGVAHGRYTFMSHLKWTPVIALGYAAGIAMHFVFQ